MAEIAFTDDYKDSRKNKPDSEKSSGMTLNAFFANVKHDRNIEAAFRLWFKKRNGAGYHTKEKAGWEKAISEFMEDKG